MTALDTRRRRAAYRASHRGTKEMDWLLGRFADARLADMPEDELERLQRLVGVPDPHLHSWIMSGGESAENELSGLVAEIRAFHGLAPDAGARAP